MSWKSGIQISDLPARQRLELTCLACGGFRFVEAGKLHGHEHLAVKYLDEYERESICHKWACPGQCRLSLPPDIDTEGFQGGLA